MGWLSRLFGSPAAVAPVVQRPVPPPPAVPARGDDEGADPAPGTLLAWLLDGPAPEPTALTLEEQRLIARIDEVLSHGQIDDRLLPRASAIVPQLMALLRQADASLAAIAQRIAQDAPLAAEVLRAAAAAAHGGGAVQDIANAVQRIGATGVQQAVARVVFRPMYSSSAGSLGARAAPRLWQWSERSSEAAAEQARAAGLPAFDGYLAGLLHGTGWTILLRIADRSAIGLKLPLSQVAAAALDKRAHRLFGLAAQRWQITPGFNALGDEASASPLAQSALPLGQCLRRAEAMVLLQRVAPQPVLATP